MRTKRQLVIRVRAYMEEVLSAIDEAESIEDWEDILYMWQFTARGIEERIKFAMEAK